MNRPDTPLRDALRAFVRDSVPHRPKNFRSGHRLLDALARRGRQLQNQGVRRDEILIHLIDELAAPAESDTRPSAADSLLSAPAPEAHIIAGACHAACRCGCNNARARMGAARPGVLALLLGVGAWLLTGRRG